MDNLLNEIATLAIASETKPTDNLREAACRMAQYDEGVLQSNPISGYPTFPDAAEHGLLISQAQDYVIGRIHDIQDKLLSEEAVSARRTEELSLTNLLGSRDWQVVDGDAINKLTYQQASPSAAERLSALAEEDPSVRRFLQHAGEGRTVADIIRISGRPHHISDVLSTLHTEDFQADLLAKNLPFMQSLGMTAPVSVNDAVGLMQSAVSQMRSSAEDITVDVTLVDDSVDALADSLSTLAKQLDLMARLNEDHLSQDLEGALADAWARPVTADTLVSELEIKQFVSTYRRYHIARVKYCVEMLNAARLVARRLIS